MRYTLLFLSLTILFIISGCASQSGHIDGPFAVYSHKTFVVEETGETGLFIDGEDWYALMDLHGFANADSGIESQNQFLVRKDLRKVTASISAQKTDPAEGEADCRKNVYRELPYRHTAELDIRNIGNKRVMAHTVLREKQIDYCPSYKGYCFDFRFSMDEKMNDDAVQGIIDSIVFIDDAAIKGKLPKVFLIYNKKLQLPLPDNWTYAFKSGAASVPSIVFSPSEGNNFQVYLSPFSGFDGSESSWKKAKASLERKLAKWEDRAVEKPSLKMPDSSDVTITYFEFADRENHQEDPSEFLYQRHGYAIIGDCILNFSILFKEEGRADADKVFDSLSKAQVIGMYQEPTISLKKDPAK